MRTVRYWLGKLRKSVPNNFATGSAQRGGRRLHQGVPGRVQDVTVCFP